MPTFSERLMQAARRHFGYEEDEEPTQAEIARALGLKRQTVNYWFTSGATPDNVVDIAAKVGVSAEWLHSGEGNMLADAPRDLPDDERELLRDYRSATPKTRQLIKTFARAARKSVLFLVATIPPLLSPSNLEAATLHKTTWTASFLHIVKIIISIVKQRRFQYV